MSGIRKTKTVEIYCSAARMFERFIEEKYTILTVHPNILSDFVSEISRTLKPRSVHVFIYGVKQYIKWMRQSGYGIQELYTPQLPRIKTSIPLILEEGALIAYLETCKTVVEPYSSAMRLLGVSTLRIGELCRLKLSDIDNTKYGVILTISDEAKGGARRTPTPKQFKAILQEYIMNYRGRVSDSVWLFPSKKDKSKHIDPKQIRVFFRQIRYKLGLTGFTPHTLRRTWLTIMHREGVDVILLQKIAGHKNLATTSIYISPSEEDMFGAVNKAFMGGKK